MTARAFLNVETSMTGRRWVGPLPEERRLAKAMVQITALPPALCQIFAQRGIGPTEAETFLAPTLRDLLPDPLTHKDMGCAAARFLAAINARQRIATFADYDVDGGSPAALLMTYLRAFGLDATLYIPDRIDEGYVPNEPSMAQLGAGHDLIICVDCGTHSQGPIAAANCDVVVPDHHLGGETLPAAVAVVNPYRMDESGDLVHLCAAGVVFLLRVEVSRHLSAKGDVHVPDLIGFLDLIAHLHPRRYDAQRCHLCRHRRDPRIAAARHQIGPRDCRMRNHLAAQQNRINPPHQLPRATEIARGKLAVLEPVRHTQC